MPTAQPRCIITVSEELLARIQDYRFDNRFPSRSAAIIDLIQKGLQVVENQEKEPRHE